MYREEVCMDASETYKLNGDDMHAVSSVALALLFLLSKTPRSTKSIISNFYSSPGEDPKKGGAADKNFMRDRDRFASLGLYVESVRDAGEPAWRLDCEATLVENDDVAALLPDIAFALSPLLKDPNFVRSSDLATALVKLSPDFESPLDGVRRDASPLERKLREAHASRIAVKAKYRRQDGTTKTCVLLPYGFFALWNRRYVVCADADNPAEPPHTYLVSRFESVTFKRAVRYGIPDGFDIMEHERLPIQMGPEVARASFLVPADAPAELKPMLRRHGRLEAREDGSYVAGDIPIASIPLASSWAYANGIVPLSPSGLVEDYRTTFAPVQ
jgi:hypothetical protein